MKHKRLIIAVTGCALLTGAAAALWGGGSHKTGLQQSHLLAELSGFKPGDRVSYTTIYGPGEAVTQQGQINEKGALALEKPEGEAAAKAPQAVNLSVESDKNPVNLYLKFRADTRQLSASANGLDSFSNVEMAYDDQKVESKADWAGSFQTQTNAQTGNSPKPLEFAFFNNNVISDGVTDPLTIKVLESPGGGGPDATSVNTYQNSYCGDSSLPSLSVCITNEMKTQIDNIKKNYVTAFLLMGEQFSAVMMQYVGSIGMFLDAKQQMETQRLQESLVAQAHRDYHPSEQMCRFGSFIKSVTKAEQKMAHEQQAFNKIMMSSYTGVENASTAEGYALDIETRLRQFRKVYCDPKDNNNGLEYLCQHEPSNPEITKDEKIGGQDKNRLNKDIDYARTADLPLTLDINFLDEKEKPTADEEDVVALAKNLYWPKAFERGQEEAMGKDYPVYMNARRVMAMENVAHNSFAHMIAAKSRSPDDSKDSGARYMKSLMREFGLSDKDIDDLLGVYPSYNAQMDVLTKKIYQSPDFYTNLLDKPANVERIGVAMDAIKLMQIRDLHEASMRREMLQSMLIEQGVSKQVEKNNAAIISIMALGIFVP